DAEDVFLLHDEVLFAIQRDLAPRVLAEQDPVARLHREGNALPFFGHPAGPDGDDLAFLGLLLGGVGDHDAAALDLSLLEALHQNAVVERTKGRLHCLSHGVDTSLVQMSVFFLMCPAATETPSDSRTPRASFARPRWPSSPPRTSPDSAG